MCVWVEQLCIDTWGDQNSGIRGSIFLYLVNLLLKDKYLVIAIEDSGYCMESWRLWQALKKIGAKKYKVRHRQAYLLIMALNFSGMIDGFNSNNNDNDSDSDMLDEYLSMMVSKDGYTLTMDEIEKKISEKKQIESEKNKIKNESKQDMEMDMDLGMEMQGSDGIDMQNAIEKTKGKKQKRQKARHGNYIMCEAKGLNVSFKTSELTENMKKSGMKRGPIEFNGYLPLFELCGDALENDKKIQSQREKARLQVFEENKKKQELLWQKNDIVTDIGSNDNSKNSNDNKNEKELKMKEERKEDKDMMNENNNEICMENSENVTNELKKDGSGNDGSNSNDNENTNHDESGNINDSTHQNDLDMAKDNQKELKQGVFVCGFMHGGFFVLRFVCVLVLCLGVCGR